MQTFIAFPDYYKSMEVLDPSRLGNQVYREGMTLLRGGWPNHPASTMWRRFKNIDYKVALCNYLLAGIKVLETRNRFYPHIKEEIELIAKQSVEQGFTSDNPPWLGNEKFHLSHRRALLTKKYDWYKNYFTNDLPFSDSELIKKGKLVSLPYYWPTKILT